MISKKVGIYAGTFDPIHEGHLAFAQKALDSNQLDKIFFLVEPRPRRKQGVRALEHREAMARLAIAENDKFGMIMLDHASFSVEDTLPKLQALFSGAQLQMLMGEDVLLHLHSWPHVDDLLNKVKFIVGIRAGDEAKIRGYLKTLEKTRGIKFEASFIATEKQIISSSSIRLSLKRGHIPKGLPAELLPYIREHNLYSSNEE